MKVINPCFASVENKLMEARFFLNHLEKVPTNPDNPALYLEATYYLSAFASSSRSITFVMQKVMKRTPGFAEWYEKKRNELRLDSIAKLVIEARNEIEKEGESRITGSYEMRNKSGGVDKGWSIEYDDNNNSITSDVSFVCKKYLETLRRIVEECAVRFSVEYDPEKLWSIEGLNKLGTTIQEIEKQYRLPGFLFKGMSNQEQIEAIRTMEAIEPPILFLLPPDRAKRLGRLDPFSPIIL